jgi:hypothetical protein
MSKSFQPMILSTRLANLTAAGDIPAVRMGRAVRYDIADLDAWIEQNKRTS